MSYNCEIAFKTIKAEEVYDFLVKFKTDVRDHLSEIVKDEFVFSPICRYATLEQREKLAEGKASLFYDTDMRALYIETQMWVKQLFSHRYFYLPEKQLLGVYSVNKLQHKLFDDVIYFQNSCDTDYDFGSYVNIPCFKSISEEWQNKSLEELNKVYKERMTDFDLPNSEEKWEYYRRTFAYDDIWAVVEDTLWDEKSVVYLSLFGHYEIREEKTCINALLEENKKWLKESAKLSE